MLLEIPVDALPEVTWKTVLRKVDHSMRGRVLQWIAQGKAVKGLQMALYDNFMSAAEVIVNNSLLGKVMFLSPSRTQNFSAIRLRQPDL